MSSLINFVEDQFVDEKAYPAFSSGDTIFEKFDVTEFPKSLKKGQNLNNSSFQANIKKR